MLALLATIEPTELIDPTVGAERLLYRLFHEHGVRVFEGVTVADQCSCSRDKIRGILDGFSAEEIKDSIEDGAHPRSAASSARRPTSSTRRSFEPVERRRSGAAPQFTGRVRVRNVERKGRNGDVERLAALRCASCSARP